MLIALKFTWSISLKFYVEDRDKFLDFISDKSIFKTYGLAFASKAND